MRDHYQQQVQTHAQAAAARQEWDQATAGFRRLAIAANAELSRRPLTETEARRPEWLGVEVSRRVIAFVPVHVDHDRVERADTRHGPTIADSSTVKRMAALGATAARARKGAAGGVI
jgi:hypothetical protein